MLHHFADNINLPKQVSKSYQITNVTRNFEILIAFTNERASVRHFGSFVVSDTSISAS